ncbi:MAG: DUF4142 domain-containing protein [Thermoanaerobaculia bacterium]
MSKRTLPAIAAAGLLALAPAFAQNQGSSHTGHGAHGSTIETGHANPDEHFIHEAAAGGMMEVELGRLAAERAASPEVKAFGQRMVTDHGKANQQLMTIAASKGMTLPRELPAGMQRERDLLARMSGAEFDRMYMHHMVKDHKKDVAEFEKQAEKGTDLAVRTFAQQTLPTLREHLTLAESLAAKQTR